MQVQIHCPCSQPYAVPNEHAVWTVSCHVCGRKLTVARDGRVRETAHAKRIDSPASAQPAAAIKAMPVCVECGVPIDCACGWCGRNHCANHVPEDHPLPPGGASLKSRGVALDDLGWTFTGKDVLFWVAFALLLFLPILWGSDLQNLGAEDWAWFGFYWLSVLGFIWVVRLRQYDRF